VSVGNERPFALDAFQREAIDHLDEGRSVVVAAPTGAGKTVVAEHALDLALRDGSKAFYTTPIKALSNQKFHDFRRRHGADAVGLLTGDTSVNGDAPIIVMTTEVLRNMLYAQSPALRGLRYVILDEVHYLQDPYRGPVWEEVLIHAPPAIRFVCLSATVSNAAELTEWISTVRGPAALVVHENRPVDLTNLYVVHDRDTRGTITVPTLVNGGANTEGGRFSEEPQPRQRGQRQRRRRRWATPRRGEVLDVLEDGSMLPAIVFVFSRAGCDDAARQLVDDGVALTEVREQAQIRAIAEHHVRNLRAADLDVLRYDRFLRGLERGVAAHHAGMVPAFKETVEECFVRGLVKIVFATETLALGINMPARAVVIERMTKFNGDTHEFLTPLEYTQLTGRAGRRGIDDQGYALVLWSPHVAFEQVADLASSRIFSLRSVFRPSYNMAVNLVRLQDRQGAHDLLDQCFGQFQADRDLTGMSRRRRSLEEELAELERGFTADGGNLPEPDEELANDGEPEDGETHSVGRDPAIEAALSRLRPGEIIATPGDHSEPAAVLSVAYRGGGTVKILLIGASHRRLTLGLDDFTTAPEVLGSVVLPEPYQPNNGSFQHEVVRKLKRARFKKRRSPIEEDVAPPRQAAHRGGDQQSSGDQRTRRIAEKRRQIRRIEQRMEGRATRLARQFDDIVGILQMRGYVANWDVTDAGSILKGLFHESDLAVAETIRLGLLDGLSPPELAALLSCFTYEHRGSTPPPSPRLRSATLRERFAAVEGLIGDLRALETEAGVRLTREVDSGFAAGAAAWAGGSGLADVLGDDDDITGGDFVRQVRQLVDLLRQVGSVAPNTATRQAAHQAADALHRGVVVASAAADDNEQVDEGRRDDSTR
jgi:ATP-dependent RNA helicase HelY